MEELRVLDFLEVEVLRVFLVVERLSPLPALEVLDVLKLFYTIYRLYIVFFYVNASL